MLNRPSVKIRLLWEQSLLLWPSSSSAGAAEFKDIAGSETLHLFNDRCVFFFVCKKQQLDPNELGAQQETVWIKSSCLSLWQMLLLQAAAVIAVWMGLRCDKHYLAGNLSCLTPSKGRRKLVNMCIAYRYVCLLSIKNL